MPSYCDVTNSTYPINVHHTPLLNTRIWWGHTPTSRPGHHQTSAARKLAYMPNCIRPEVRLPLDQRIYYLVKWL